MTPLQSSLQEILALLRQPCDQRVLAQRTQLSPAVLQGLLTQLKARGWVTTATPGVGACQSGCGLCSMQNFCPSSQTQERAEEPPQSSVWRLTPLGAKQV